MLPPAHKHMQILDSIIVNFIGKNSYRHLIARVDYDASETPDSPEMSKAASCGLVFPTDLGDG